MLDFYYFNSTKLEKFISTYRTYMKHRERMKLEEILKELKSRDATEELTRKRFACANCGSTWVEAVGLVIGRRSGREDLCLRIGMESEACQVCRMKTRTCEKCGSRDVYELRFEKDVSEAPMNFKGIRTVNREDGT